MSRLKRLILGLAIIGLAAACYAQGIVAEHPSGVSSTEARTMKVRLTVNGQSLTTILIDSPTTRDFVALLPLTLTLEDYASTEKIAYLPRKLSTQGAPAGVTPSAGDITYYAPWGNLALFYRGFRYSEGLVRLGRFDAGIEALEVRGSLKVTIDVER